MIADTSDQTTEITVNQPADLERSGALKTRLASFSLENRSKTYPPKRIGIVFIVFQAPSFRAYVTFAAIFQGGFCLLGIRLVWLDWEI